MKMLPPAPSDVTVQTGLSMASEGLTIAIAKLLEDRTDNSRFSEISELATMAQDIQRHAARVQRSVRAYAGTGRVCTNEDLEAYGDPAVDEAIRRARQRNQRNNPDAQWLGAPRDVGENDLGNGLGPMQGLFDTLAGEMREQAEGRAERAVVERHESEARELESLVRAQKHAGPGPVHDSLDARIAHLTARIARTPKDAPDKSAALDTDAPDTSPSPPAHPISCTQCGARQSAHWVNAEGDPLDCPTCNSPTVFEGRAKSDVPIPHAPAEGATIDVAQAGDPQ